MDFCSIASGSSGNCIFVGTERTSVLIDAGISGKRVKEGLYAIDRRPEDLDAILVTHEHSDHIWDPNLFYSGYNQCHAGTAIAWEGRGRTVPYGDAGLPF